MNKIDNQTALPNNLGHNRQAKQIKNETVKQHIPSDYFDKLALSNHASISMKLIFQLVSSKVSESFNHTPQEKNITFTNTVAKNPVEEDNSLPEIFDFEEVARNVMEFVGGSILAAQANGASDDELKKMFEQGRAGANLGIDQAIGELKDLAMLDDDLSQGVEKSRDLINQNISDLYTKIFPEEKHSNSDVTLENQNIRNASLDNELYTSNSKNSDLSITTTDGDVVTISFSELQKYASKENYQYEEGNKGVAENYSMASSEYHEVHFSYSVEGELDDEEKAAIEALIKDVNSLQKDFFSGNIDQAFEKAIDLGFDNEQIANFSMDLQQTRTSYVSQTYTEVAEFDEKVLPSANKELRPLIDFLEQFKQLQEKADSILSKNDDAFGQLLDAVFNAEFGEDKEKKEKLDKVIEIVKPEQQSN
jgi:hypothetical protein